MPPEILIEPSKNSRTRIREIWAYRELFLFLAWRDLLVRYKQTLIGIAWSILRPLLTLIILTIVFNKIANLSSGNVPYLLLVLAGLLPWQFFSNSLSDSSNSLLSNSNLITKVYFPRIIVPSGSVLVSLVDFFISLILMLVFCFFYDYSIGWQVIFLPLFLILSLAFTLAAGIFLSALIIKYRDVKYIIPFIAQLGIYASPVGFPSSAIPEEFRYWYYLNPLVGIIDGFRWCFFGEQYQVLWIGVFMSCCVVVVCLIFAIRYFIRTEKFFADII